MIAFLSNPLSYSPPPSQITRVDTHGAIIFLAGRYAYKLKRAVKLPYLDFSTVEKREAVCRNELRRNKAAAPQIYISAEPIVRAANGGLTIGGDGEAIDWVVVMNRFEAGCLLDDLAKEKRLERSVMTALAQTISQYHDCSERRCSADGDSQIAAIVAQIVRSFGEHAELIDRQRCTAIGAKLLRELDARSCLLRSRSRAGYVRLCHGDLHLQNIVMWQGQPTLFDAIEFNDKLATIDVLYDLAFVLMDLWHRGLNGHANLCFSTYVARAMTTAAISGLAALPLFMALRAAVRAMVTLDRLDIAARGDAEALVRDIDAYVSLAETFLEPSKPQLIAVGGLSGTGKSTLAAALAPITGGPPGALHLRSDVERKLMAGVDPLERLAKSAYSQEVSDHVYSRLAERAEAALSAGCSVIVDAVFNETGHRRQIEDLAERRGVRLQGLWLDAPADVLLARVAARTGDASDADAEVVRQQLAGDDAPMDWYKVDAGAPPDTVTERALEALATPDV